jgi:hypothetical protein
MKPADASGHRPVAAASGPAKDAPRQTTQDGKVRQSVPVAATRVTLF